MAAFLRTVTSFSDSLLPRASGFVPWCSSHRIRRQRHLNRSLKKQFSSDALIYGSNEWSMVRPATAEEHSYEIFHRYCARQGIMKVIFNSQNEIGEETWRKALLHATRKLEVLRLCFLDRGDKMWLCEVNNHDIDFKITESKTVLEVAEELKNEGLDHSFWSVRVVPDEPGKEHPIPDLKQKLPFQYDFLFKFHHGLMDGYCIGYCIRIFSEILDDVLSGKIVDNDIKFGKFLYDDPLKTKVQVIQNELESDPLHLDEEKERMLRLTMKQPILYLAYPKPKGIQTTTHHIVRKVSNTKIYTLNNHCKSKNLKMTAIFEAAFNTALVEMVRDAGVVRNEYKINMRQTIDMRRYMNVEKDFNKFSLGCFLGGMQQEAQCGKVVRKQFWKHATEINSDFHSLLKNNGPIIESIVRPQVQGSLNPEVLAKGPPRDNSDYAFANVLDVTPLMFYEGTQVQLTDIVSYNFINNFLHPILFQFSTYRGSGQLTCSYDTAKLADDTAQELMDRIMNVLDFVTK